MTSQSSSSSSKKSDPDLVSEVGEALVPGAWRFRVEVVLVGAVAGCFFELERHLGEVPAAVAVCLAVATVLALAPTRRRLFSLLVRRHWRRKLERAFAGLAHECFGGRPLCVRLDSRTGSCVQGSVVLRAGQAPSHLERAAERLATALSVAEVRVERDRRSARRCLFTLVTEGPFGRGALPCPWGGLASADLWEPVPVGEDELGRPVEVALGGHNVLAGGEPGSGKSNFLQLLAARAALDPSAKLWLLDPKVVELARWAKVAAGSAGADLEGAIGVLEALTSEMTARYEYQAERGARKVTPSDGLGLHLLIVDEAMIYLADPDKKSGTRFAEAFRKLLALGRAAGIVVVLATQKPSTEVVPSSLRDLISVRVAFRSTTRESSDTILGSGWTARGISASGIDPSTPGVCYFLAGSAEPGKLRCYHLDDEALGNIVERAGRLAR